MKKQSANKYFCPYSKRSMTVTASSEMGSEVIEGSFATPDGKAYPIRDGIPRLISEDDEVFSEEERRENEYYEATAREYDHIMDWMFQSFGEIEDDVREKMVGLLALKPGARVLETGSGTCRDSVHIAKKLQGKGEFFIQDLSPSMLSIGRDRMRAALGTADIQPEFFVGNAVHLPFKDNYFDAAFHFGGLNVFTDKRAAVAEMARVVKPGGKVVFGDEGLAPWHRSHEYGQILMNSSKLYAHEAPIDLLPESAREVALRWVIGNAYYLIEFTVADGAPHLEMDLVIPGKKGGTHRTRWQERNS